MLPQKVPDVLETNEVTIVQYLNNKDHLIIYKNYKSKDCTHVKLSISGVFLTNSRSY